MFQGHLCRSVGCKPKYCLVLGLCGQCRFCVENLAQWPRLLCTPITHRLTRKSQIQRLPNARNLEVWSPFFLRQNDRSRSTNTPPLWHRARDKTSGTRRYFCGLWHYGGYRLPSRSVALNRRKIGLDQLLCTEMLIILKIKTRRMHCKVKYKYAEFCFWTRGNAENAGNTYSL